MSAELSSALLKERFPWLGTNRDAGSGADVISGLAELYEEVVANEIKARVGIYLFPAGVVWADKQVEVAGDYQRLAFMAYDDLRLQTYTRNRSLLEYIRHDAQTYRKGQLLKTASNQSVTLGTGKRCWYWFACPKCSVAFQESFTGQETAQVHCATSKCTHAEPLTPVE